MQTYPRFHKFIEKNKKMEKNRNWRGKVTDKKMCLNINGMSR